jgi:hypothetical protein
VVIGNRRHPADGNFYLEKPPHLINSCYTFKVLQFSEALFLHSITAIVWFVQSGYSADLPEERRGNRASEGK